MFGVLLDLHDHHRDLMAYAQGALARYSPNTKVVVLSTFNGTVRPYLRRAKQFTPHYSHDSLNPYRFELNCFLRWQILADWITANDVHERVWVQDNDVLVLNDLHKIDSEILKGGLSCIPHSLWHPQDIIIFAEEVMAAFSEHTPLWAKVQEYRKSGRHPTLSDMAFEDALSEDAILPPYRVTPGVGWVLDPNIACSNGWEMDRGVKKIQLEGGRAFGFYERRREPAGWLHFWGPTKSLIPKVWKTLCFPRSKPCLLADLQS